MIHQFRDKKKIERRRSIIRTIIALGIFLALCALGFLAWSGHILHFVAKPVWKAENAASGVVEDMGYVVRTKASVYAENDRLKEENATDKAAMIDYQILKKENEDLKALLGRLPAENKFTLATILTKPNRSPYDTIIIDIGSDAGITEGQRVFADGNIPIGTINTVYATTSLVMLYSNPGQTTEGALDGSNASVELLGRGGGNFEMTIPLDLSSESGSYVVMPAAKTEVLAIVDSVISNPTDPVKKVLLRSPANIQGLKWVEVKTN